MYSGGFDVLIQVLSVCAHKGDMMSGLAFQS